MSKSLREYKIMIAHSGDTAEFVSVVKEATKLFQEDFKNYNNDEELRFEVKDYNDEVFSTYDKRATQTVVFEQFAGHSDMLIALIGKRMGDGLKQELLAAEQEGKQTFVYLYNKALPYDVFDSKTRKHIRSETKNIQAIARKFFNIGYAKVFYDSKQLTECVKSDIGRFLRYKKNYDYELSDPSYIVFSFDEVDRYRNEIAKVVPTINSTSIPTDASALSEYYQNKISSQIKRDREHARASINELLRLLRSLISKRFRIEESDISATFAWGYHEPGDGNESVIIPTESIGLNHSGEPAKLKELLERKSLLRFMLTTGASFEWYQYKSDAYKDNRYYWSRYEYDEKKKTSDRIKKNLGGSIFCYRIGLNGDGAETNNYAVGFVMVSTHETPITNTIHDSIRNQTERTIKHMLEMRIKPQLLVEMSQLYLAYLEEKALNPVGPHQQSNATSVSDINNAIITEFNRNTEDQKKARTIWSRWKLRKTTT